MATTARRGVSVKRQDVEAGDAAGHVVRDQVEELARAGARQMLLAALDEEVNAYLQRDRYQRQAVFRGYRNGTTPRRLTLGRGTVPLDVPRVRDTPAEQTPFESKILRKYQCRSDTIDETFMRLFIEGLATRDFEPACWIADGALGLWAAVNEQSPHSAQQRCANHKTMNVIDKLPKAEQLEATTRVRAIWQAESESAARKLAAALIADFRRAGYERAADCLADDLDRCLTFYQFPEPHWSHLRTSNVIESPFAGVRLRTNAAKRFKKTRSGVYLVHQVLLRLSQTWRRLKAAHLCGQVPLPVSKTKSGRKTNAG